MNFFNKYRGQIYFHLFLNLIVGLFITLSSYYHIPLSSFKDYSIYFVHFLLLQFSFFGILYFLSINKYIFYTVFPIIFLSLSLLGFYKYSLDITISMHLIEAIFEVSLLVSLDLISIYSLLLIAVLILILFFVFRLYTRIKVNQLKSPLIILAILGIFTYFIIEKIRHDTFNSRLPYAAFHGVKDYLSSDLLTLKKVPLDVTSEKEDVNFIFVLGESVRADHMQLNGYKKGTNPRLVKRNNLISYTNLYTKNTHTVASIKQILTDKSLDDNEEGNRLYSIYSVLNTASFNTYWIANGDIVKGYEPIIKSNKELLLVDKFKTVMSFNKSLDQDMFVSFDTIYKKKENQFISMHMIGSHWWYENRYSDDFRKFNPVIKSKYIPSLKEENLINSYDNTIVYLDYFLDELIKRVDKKNDPSIVMYVSDHGESLGENGKWLHAQEAEACKNPAMVIWYSDSFKNKYPKYVESLNEYATKKLTTDFFYHSIIDFYKIENFNYNKDKSIFRKGNYLAN